jgi:hypothetical protein
MIEICPAGPPKLMKPSFSQKTKASQKLTGAGRPQPFGHGGGVVHFAMGLSQRRPAGHRRSRWRSSGVGRRR